MAEGKLRAKVWRTTARALCVPLVRSRRGSNYRECSFFTNSAGRVVPFVSQSKRRNQHTTEELGYSVCWCRAIGTPVASGNGNSNHPETVAELTHAAERFPNHLAGPMAVGKPGLSQSV